MTTTPTGHRVAEVTVNGDVITTWFPRGTETTEQAFKQLVPTSSHTKAGAGTREHWRTPLPDAALLITWADQHNVAVPDDLRHYATTATTRAVRNAARAANTTPTRVPAVRGLLATLLPTQSAFVESIPDAWVTTGINRTPSHRAVILADEPGLGKTLQALSALRIEGSIVDRAVIVCPTDLAANWVKEAAETFFAPGTFTPWVAQSRTPTTPPAGVDLVVVGWAILSDWRDELVAWRPDGLIIDEAQYGKSGELVYDTVPTPTGRDAAGNIILTPAQQPTAGSNRGDAYVKLARQVISRRGLILPLTGTPILYRPLDLLPLLQVAGLISMVVDATTYKERYCGPRNVPNGNGGRTRTYKGHSNEQELHRKLVQSGHFARRTKKILVESGVLQPKYVDGVNVFDRKPGTPWQLHLSPAALADYRLAETDLAEFLLEEYRRALQRGDPDAVRRHVAGKAFRKLQEIATLRRLVAVAKIPDVIAAVNLRVNQGHKVLVIAHHRDVVDQYAAAWSGLKIQGGMGNRRIEEAKRLFNTTPASEHPVLVLSVDAGKTGHTLCLQEKHGVGPACSSVVFAEQIQSPADFIQASDRVWRVGQPDPVTVIAPVAVGTIDADYYTKRVETEHTINAIIDGVPLPPEPASSVEEDIAWRLIRQGGDVPRH